MVRPRALWTCILLAAALVPGAAAANETVHVSDFSFSPSSVTVGQGEEVTWSFDGGFHNVVWQTPGAPANCPDNGPCTRAFPAVGTFSYRCQYHGSMTGTVTVNAAAPANQAPSAAFAFSTNGLAVSVDAAGSTDADGTIAGYAWSWGDGSPAGSGASAGHTYATGGNYTVTLTVTDDDGATDSEAKSVGVAAPNVAPTAAFTLVVSHLAVTVDASGSSDADGVIASYAWSWGDGTTGSGPATSHTYAAAGSYAVQLTVTDDDGAVATLSKQADASAPPPSDPPSANVAPTAAFTYDVDNRTVRVDASGSSDPDGRIVRYDWAWGDGARTDGNATETHVYDRPGAPTIRLTVTDDDGATHTIERVVELEGPSHDAEPPTPAFSIRQDGLTVRVNASTSRDAQGNVSGYGWDWGDGSPEDKGVEAAHAYAAPGSYVITLTAHDEAGNTADESRLVELVASQAGSAPEADFRYALAGRTLVATSLATDADGDIARYAWTFGDGTTAIGGEVTHAYRLRGTFTVRHEVIDAAGHVATFEQQIATPANLAPKANVTSMRDGSVVTLRADARDADGEVVNLTWDFGDGTAPAFEVNATHHYARDDLYVVELRLADDEGATTIVEHTADLRPQAPATSRDSSRAPEDGGAIPGADLAIMVAALAAALLIARRR